MHDEVLTPITQHWFNPRSTLHTRRKDDHEKHNNCERSCMWYGHRTSYRSWTNRAQRADVLLLRLQVQRNVRSSPGAICGQVCGNAQEQPGLLQLSPTTPPVNAMPTTDPCFCRHGSYGLMSFRCLGLRGVLRGRCYGGSRSRPMRYGLRQGDLEGPAMRRSQNDV